jgi:hypothetical protein
MISAFLRNTSGPPTVYNNYSVSSSFSICWHKKTLHLLTCLSNVLPCYVCLALPSNNIKEDVLMNFWHPAAFHLHHCTINQDAAYSIAPKNQYYVVCCR